MAKPKSNKEPMTIYIPGDALEAMDERRAEVAEELGITNLSRGDYIARLVKEDLNREK